MGTVQAYICIVTDDSVDDAEVRNTDRLAWAREWLAETDGVTVTPAPPGLSGTAGLPYLALKFGPLVGELRVLEIESLRVLVLVFPYNGFMNGMEERGGEVVSRFVELCNVHWPRAAFIDTLGDQDVEPTIRVTAQDAAMFDGCRLWQEDVPIVYLDSVLAQNLPPDAVPAARPDMQTRFRDAFFLGRVPDYWHF